MIFDGPYTELMKYMPSHYPKKYWSGTPVGCAICKRGNVTLMKREGKRICRACYAEILKTRTLKGDQI